MLPQITPAKQTIVNIHKSVYLKEKGVSCRVAKVIQHLEQANGLISLNIHKYLVCFVLIQGHTISYRPCGVCGQDLASMMFYLSNIRSQCLPINIILGRFYFDYTWCDMAVRFTEKWGVYLSGACWLEMFCLQEDMIYAYMFSSIHHVFVCFEYTWLLQNIHNKLLTSSFGNNDY